LEFNLQCFNLEIFNILTTQFRVGVNTGADLFFICLDFLIFLFIECFEFIFYSLPGINIC